MRNVGIYASRHRVIEHYLNLDKVSGDYVTSPFSYSWVNFNDLEVEFKMSSIITGFPTLFGCGGGLGGTKSTVQIYSNGTTFQFRARDENDVLTEVSAGSATTNVIQWKISGGKVYHDAVEVADLSGVGIVTNVVNQQVKFGIVVGQTTQSTYSGQLHDFKTFGDLYACNEGSGFDVVSDLGEIGTGTTANAGGLTYWNSTVWTLIP